MLISVTAPAAGRRGRSRALSARMTVPPWVSGANSSKTERSKESEVEASTPESSSGLNAAAAQRSSVTALW